MANALGAGSSTKACSSSEALQLLVNVEWRFLSFDVFL